VNPKLIAWYKQPAYGWAVQTTDVPDSGLVAEIEQAMTRLVRMATQSRMKAHFAAQTGLAIDRAAYVVLAALAQSGPMRLSELATRVAVDASTASRQVQQLERAGLLDRVVDPDDRRASLLRLSGEGERVLAVLRQARRALFERVLAGWTATEQRTFATLLARMADDLEASVTVGARA
jgi:DNA-binding MarR family transcriptional regulator